MKIIRVKTINELTNLHKTENLKNKVSDILETNISYSFRVYLDNGNTRIFYELKK